MIPNRQKLNWKNLDWVHLEIYKFYAIFTFNLDNDDCGMIAPKKYISFSKTWRIFVIHPKLFHHKQIWYLPCPIALFTSWVKIQGPIREQCHYVNIIQSVVIYGLLCQGVMMTSSNGNSFRVTDPLCGEFTGQWSILLTEASDAELWCFLDVCLNKRLSKQSWGWWFETRSRPLWRHCRV